MSIVHDHHIHCTDINMFKSIMHSEKSAKRYLTIANHNYFFSFDEMNYIKTIAEYFNSRIKLMLGLNCRYKKSKSEIEIMVEPDYFNVKHLKFLEMIYKNNLIYNLYLIEELRRLKQFISIGLLMKTLKKKLHLITLEDMLHYLINNNEEEEKTIKKKFIEAIKPLEKPKIDYDIVYDAFNDSGITIVNPDTKSKILKEKNIIRIVSNDPEFVNNGYDVLQKKILYGSGKCFYKYPFLEAYC